MDEANVSGAPDSPSFALAAVHLERATDRGAPQGVHARDAALQLLVDNVRSSQFTPSQVERLRHTSDSSSPVELPFLSLPHNVVALPGCVLRLGLHDVWRGGGVVALIDASATTSGGRPLCCIADVVPQSRWLEVTVKRRAFVLSSGASSARVQEDALDEQMLPPPPDCLHAPFWVANMRDAAAMARRLRAMPAVRACGDSTTLAALSPQRLSWWAAQNLPLDVTSRRELLAASSAAARLVLLCRMVAKLNSLRCARCGLHWASAADVFCASEPPVGPQHSPPAPPSSRVETFVNPHGYVHTVCTLRRAAEGALALDVAPPQAQGSWFEGFRWVIAICSRCGAHAGWKYTAAGRDDFWGLHVAAFTIADEEEESGGDDDVETGDDAGEDQQSML